MAVSLQTVILSHPLPKWMFVLAWRRVISVRMCMSSQHPSASSMPCCSHARRRQLMPPLSLHSGLLDILYSPGSQPLSVKSWWSRIQSGIDQLAQTYMTLFHYSAEALDSVLKAAAYQLYSPCPGKKITCDAGGKVTRDAGPVKGGKRVIAFVEDPTGYKWELITREKTDEPIAQVRHRLSIGPEHSCCTSASAQGPRGPLDISRLPAAAHSCGPPRAVLPLVLKSRQDLQIKHGRPAVCLENIAGKGWVRRAHSGVSTPASACWRCLQFAISKGSAGVICSVCRLDAGRRNL